MSVFTNPASGAERDAKAYVAAVLGLLGDRDPMAVLRETDAALQRQLGAMPAADVAIREAPGKWSAMEVFAHLADSELVWGYRLRTVLAEDRPRLTGYDQDRWAERLGYERSDPGESLALFGALRRANLRLLDRASERDLQRIAIHAERGEESIAHMVRLYAGHDLLHLRQLERIAGAVGDRSA